MKNRRDDVGIRTELLERLERIAVDDDTAPDDGVGAGPDFRLGLYMLWLLLAELPYHGGDLVSRHDVRLGFHSISPPWAFIVG